VVDASALSALLFGEPDADEVAAKLEDRELLAPTLVLYEVASVGLKKLMRHPEQRNSLRSALGLLPRLQIRQIEAPVEALVELAEREKLSTYDAAYLWLARELGCELVTLDRALAAAALGDVEP
jgi:predicted nucleic acid-binding protein